MTRIHNGPARNTPKGARTRAELAATVPAAPGRCACPGGNGIPLVTFRDQQPVQVERRHLRGQGCQQLMSIEPVAQFLAGIGHR